MFGISPVSFADIYAGFHSPIALLNCGDKCAPFNENNVPFCCDIKHAVPSAYQSEWIYLQENSDLWQSWKPENNNDFHQLNSEKPSNQVLLQCKGHLECQRNFRTLTCRAFPFFPYIDRYGNFIGISYYWDYANRCWIISNLNCVTQEYLQEMITTFDKLFEQVPNEKVNFKYHSMIARRVFGRWHQTITLLHRDGHIYAVTPATGDLRVLDRDNMEKFSPYDIVGELPFPDEES